MRHQSRALRIIHIERGYIDTTFGRGPSQACPRRQPSALKIRRHLNELTCDSHIELETTFSSGRQRRTRKR